MLGHRELAVGFGLNDGIAGILHVGYPLPIDQAVPTRTLSAAFNDVPGHGTGSQSIPVCLTPSEIVYHRSECETGVGDAARDDYVTAPLERLHQWPRSQIRVRAPHRISHRRERLTGVHVLELMTSLHQCIQPVEDVVTGNDGDPHLAR